MNKYISLAMLIILYCSVAKTQTSQTITLEECQLLARKNYPLLKQQELLKKSSELALDNLGKAYLPQISINGQASYQSAVTTLPIRLPGIEIPELSKDQYKIYAELSQTIYDGGAIRQQKVIQESASVIEEHKLEVELYKTKDLINQLFFGILLIDEQLKLSALLIKDLSANVRKATALIENGMAYKSNVNILQAEILKTRQRETELNQNRKSFTEMLSLFTVLTLDEKTTFIKPELPALSPTIARPEMLLLDKQEQNLQLQREFLRSKNRPKFSLFLQGGYGRPALNMLDNSFEPYYIGGLRMFWPLSGLYTLKNDKARIEINEKNINVQKEMFLFNTSYALKQKNSEVNKYQELLITDEEIIKLREQIKTTATLQLENGVISANDLIRELIAEEQARETKSIHEIQLLLSMHSQKITTGQ